MPEQALAAKPLDALMWRASDLKRQGKWLHAAQYFVDAIDAYPDHVPAILELAHIYLERRQWHAAQDVLHRGLIRVPGDSLLNLHLGNAYLGQGSLDMAISHYRAAVKSDAKNAAALYNLGLALVRKGRNAEAITALSNLESFRPGYPGLAELLGNTHLGVGKPGRALEALLRAESRDGDTARLQYLLGRSLSELGRWSEAEYRLRKALTRAPADPEIMRCYGWALIQLLNIDGGIAWLRRAIDTDPTLVYAHVDLAMALKKQGRVAEGRASLEAARRLDPDNTWIADRMKEWEQTMAAQEYVAVEGPNGTRGEN